MTQQPCPCCGQPLPEDGVSVHVLSDVPLSKLERRMVDLLASEYPREVKRDKIVHEFYCDDPDGGPIWAETIPAQIAIRLRSKLPRYGWTISKATGGRDNPGCYKLERVHD